MSFDMPASEFRPVSHQVLWHNGAKTWHVRLVAQNVLKAVAILKILTGQSILQFYTHLTCVVIARGQNIGKNLSGREKILFAIACIYFEGNGGYSLLF